MAGLTVASTEFQNRAGMYLERAATSPVFITRHRKPVGVLLDIEEYNRMKARDTRQALWAHEIPEEYIRQMENLDLSHLDPALDRLMD